jgi:hypothetical protein
MIQAQVSRLLEEAVNAVSEVSSHLPHPGFAWLIRDPSNVHPSRLYIDDEDEVPNQPKAAQHFHGEEIGSCNRSEVRLDEGVPTRTTPAFWRGFEAVRKQRVLDSVARDFVTQIVESPAESSIAPGWTLSRHFDDQFSNILLGSWPSWTTLFGSVVLGSHKVAVPAQQRVGRHDGAKLVKR